jgi:hypothetical protein
MYFEKKEHKKNEKIKKHMGEKDRLSITDITWDMVNEQLKSECGYNNIDQETMSEVVSRMFGDKRYITQEY